MSTLKGASDTEARLQTELEELQLSLAGQRQQASAVTTDLTGQLLRVSLQRVCAPPHPPYISLRHICPAVLVHLSTTLSTISTSSFSPTDLFFPVLCRAAVPLAYHRLLPM